jgi:hypothetical protein
MQNYDSKTQLRAIQSDDFVSADSVHSRLTPVPARVRRLTLNLMDAGASRVSRHQPGEHRFSISYDFL